MKYFIFDMDETLAELYSVYYFIASLRLKESCKDEKVFCNDMPDHLIQSLDKAYKLFVEEVLKKEMSAEPLGILRPGLLNVMKHLRDLQKTGEIKNVIIYSNNGHLDSLHFIRDLIHKYVASNSLIKECIHWNHPMRDEERLIRPGAANKTWNVLRNIMVNGNCKASPDIKTEDIFFFDDLDHVDLQEKLKENYYKVPAYNFKASFDRLADIYRAAIKAANVDVEEMAHYLIEVFVSTGDEYELIVAKEGPDGLMDGLIEFFRRKTRGTADRDQMPPRPDGGIEMMMAAVERVKAKKGGKRRMVITKKRKLRKFRLKSRVRKN
jgi:hypothetical protein